MRSCWTACWAGGGCCWLEEGSRELASVCWEEGWEEGRRRLGPDVNPLACSCCWLDVLNERWSSNGKRWRNRNNTLRAWGRSTRCLFFLYTAYVSTINDAWRQNRNHTSWEVRLRSALVWPPAVEPRWAGGPSALGSLFYEKDYNEYWWWQNRGTILLSLATNSWWKYALTLGM